MIVRAAGTTKRIFAISSPRRPRLGAGAVSEDGAVGSVAVVSVSASDMRRLLSVRRSRLAGASLGHRVSRSRLIGEHELHTGVDHLGGLGPLRAELAGPGAGVGHYVGEAGHRRHLCLVLLGE